MGVLALSSTQEQGIENLGCSSKEQPRTALQSSLKMAKSPLPQLSCTKTEAGRGKQNHSKLPGSATTENLEDNPNFNRIQSRPRKIKPSVDNHLPR